MDAKAIIISLQASYYSRYYITLGYHITSG
jgi:hypothetical protein